ncbi:hypothetical protein [Streptomyces vinaceus]|uniref:hypothetical protein n=1 Tax=Streptomyces vinaceus TaxID=1960 RepID=UPI00382F2319
MLAPEVRRGGGLPFGQVVSQWVCDPRYTTNLRTLYCILVTYADIGGRDTSKGRPWRSELAAQLGVSLKTLDRTLLEGECAGLLRIERRTSPRNARENDANVYHLFDARFWRGEWTDPLEAGQRACDVAAQVTAQRVEAKRKAGIVPKGGRQGKGAGVASPVTPGGGDSGDAAPGVLGDATPASPRTPYNENPIDNPDPETVRPSVGVPGSPPDNGAETKIAAGVGLLLEVAAWQPDFTLTGQTLEDQGRVVERLLRAGWKCSHLKTVISGRPLPDPLHHTVGAIVAARLRAAEAMPAPHPTAGWDALPAGRMPADRTVTEALNRRIHRECTRCAGPVTTDTNLCDPCADQSDCEAGCGRNAEHGGRCHSCTGPEPAPATAHPAGDGMCPGRDTTCGRPVQARGLCGRCLIAAAEESGPAR